MNAIGRCPICGGGRLDRPLALPGLRIIRCRSCGHRIATHDADAHTADDYHAQYDGGAFLDSLRATRVRQARLLIGILRRYVPDLSGVVDYGAGRGWFLEACRAAKVAPLAGVDTSDIAVDGLRASGIEAHRLPDGENQPGVLSRLSFRPRVITLLDVLEHFPPDELESRLRGIVSACGSELELVVVKVPVAGLLYGGATVLRGLGRPGPIRQLYQAGTWPPHFNYFSEDSAKRLLAAAGLTLVESVGDRDFEPESLAGRVGAVGASTRAIARLGGEALAVGARLSGRFDSRVFAARPSATRPG